MFLSLVSEWPKIMAIPVMLMIQKIILIHGAMIDGSPNKPSPPLRNFNGWDLLLPQKFAKDAEMLRSV